MLTPRLDYRLAHVGIKPLRFAARRQQARFAIGARPIAKAHQVGEFIVKELELPGVRFCPTECASFVFKYPRLDNRDRLDQIRPGRPKKQTAVIRGELSERK